MWSFINDARYSQACCITMSKPHIFINKYEKICFFIEYMRSAITRTSSDNIQPDSLINMYYSLGRGIPFLSDKVPRRATPEFQQLKHYINGKINK